MITVENKNGSVTRFDGSNRMSGITAELGTALLAAQKAVGHLKRDARNEYGKYNYVSSETMIAECREAMHKNGLLIVPTSIELAPHPAGTQHVLVLHAKLLHPASSGVLELMYSSSVHQAKGQGLDKCDASAHTFLLNYMLRDVLQVPRVDKEVEVDARDDSYVDHTQRAPQQRPTISTVDASSYRERMLGCKSQDELDKVAKQAGNALGRQAANAALGDTFNKMKASFVTGDANVTT